MRTNLIHGSSKVYAWNAISMDKAPLMQWLSVVVFSLMSMLHVGLCHSCIYDILKPQLSLYERL